MKDEFAWPNIMLGLFIFMVSLMCLAVLSEAITTQDKVEYANNYCKSLGYDQYKSYTDSYMLFSTKIYGIKCEYVSRLDVNVREVQNE